MNSGLNRRAYAEHICGGVIDVYRQHTFHASKAVLDDCHTIRAIHAFDGCGKVMVAAGVARSRAFRHAAYLFEVKQVGVVMQAQING